MNEEKAFNYVESFYKCESEEQIVEEAKKR